jgi:predicted dehydrogenase
MQIAIIGCGFVADYYMQSLPLYPELELAAVMDIDAARAREFAAFHRLDCLRHSIDDVLSDARIGLVLNLTNPDSHFEVSRACLLAGKHVYSEKPLAMNFAHARELAELAVGRGLQISCAPCNVLGETAQGLWKALREGRVGPVKLVYAEMDDGLVHRMPYRKWLSDSGRQWPSKDEFEVGCTLEHAGYYVTWLTAFFGPALSVSAFSTALYPDKETDVPLDRIAPDLSVACIRFASGVVARLSCSIVARRDQTLQLFGDRGILQVDTSWDYRAPVRLKRYLNVRRRMVILPDGKYPLPSLPRQQKPRRNANPMEFCRGPAEVAAAIAQGRRSHLPPDYCLHNNEIVLAIHHALENSATYPLSTTFAPVAPMPWAQ